MRIGGKRQSAFLVRFMKRETDVSEQRKHINQEWKYDNYPSLQFHGEPHILAMYRDKASRRDIEEAIAFAREQEMEDIVDMLEGWLGEMGGGRRRRTLRKIRSRSSNTTSRKRSVRHRRKD